LEDTYYCLEDALIVGHSIFLPSRGIRHAGELELSVTMCDIFCKGILEFVCCLLIPYYHSRFKQHRSSQVHAMCLHPWIVCMTRIYTV